MWVIFENIYKGEYIGALRLIANDGKTVIYGLRSFGTIYKSLEIEEGGELADWDIEKIKNNDEDIIPKDKHFRQFMSYIFECNKIRKY